MGSALLSFSPEDAGCLGMPGQGRKTPAPGSESTARAALSQPSAVPDLGFPIRKLCPHPEALCRASASICMAPTAPHSSAGARDGVAPSVAPLCHPLQHGEGRSGTARRKQRCCRLPKQQHPEAGTQEPSALPWEAGRMGGRGTTACPRTVSPAVVLQRSLLSQHLCSAPW